MSLIWREPRAHCSLQLQSMQKDASAASTSRGEAHDASPAHLPPVGFSPATVGQGAGAADFPPGLWRWLMARALPAA